jgi:hypothetical protein
MLNKLSINRFVRTLIASDFFLFFAVGLLAPIFAVFVLENVTDRLEVVGYCYPSFWILL